MVIQSWGANVCSFIGYCTSYCKQYITIYDVSTFKHVNVSLNGVYHVFSTQTRTPHDYMWGKLWKKDGCWDPSLQDSRMPFFSNLGEPNLCETRCCQGKIWCFFEGYTGIQYPKGFYIHHLFEIGNPFSGDLELVCMSPPTHFHQKMIRTWSILLPRVIVIAHDTVFVNHQLCFRRTALWKTSQENQVQSILKATDLFWGWGWGGGVLWNGLQYPCLSQLTKNTWMNCLGILQWFRFLNALDDIVSLVFRSLYPGSSLMVELIQEKQI